MVALGIRVRVRGVGDLERKAGQRQTGIPGAIAFLLIIVALIRVGWQQRKTGYLFIFLLLLIYSFMESVFETQFGIALFTFFPVFLLQEE